jgi:hypothetical protein
VTHIGSHHASFKNFEIFVNGIKQPTLVDGSVDISDYLNGQCSIEFRGTYYNNKND